MSLFKSLKSYQRLEQLAKNPIDLSKEGVLTPERISRFKAEGCGFKLLFGTQRIDDDVIHALTELSKEAKVIAQMHAMQNGEVINTIEGCESEDRRVLHTAMRQFFNMPSKATSELKEVIESAQTEFEKLSFVLDLSSEKLTSPVLSSSFIRS